MDSTNKSAEASPCEMQSDELVKKKSKKKITNLKKMDKYRKTTEKCDTDLVIDYLKCENQVVKSLNKKIFKKATINNIEKILVLLRQNEIGGIIDKYYQTVKTLFWGLVFGAIPVCEIQRQSITELQRRMVDRILNLPAKKGQLVLHEEVSEFTSFLNLIKKSLKFIIKMFQVNQVNVRSRD